MFKVQTRKNENFFYGLIKSLKKHFTDEEVKFRYQIVLSLTILPIFSVLIMYGFLTVFLQFDLYFFQANETKGIIGFEETYYHYIFTHLSVYLPYVVGFVIFNIFAGIYISQMLLRPFKSIGDYCESFMQNKNLSYDPDFFSELKLLTRFSEYFFTKINDWKEKGQASTVKIPIKYTRIHKPVLEVSFFIQYFSFVLITALCAAILVFSATIEVHQQIMSLAREILPESPSIFYFLEKQRSVLDIILMAALLIHVVLYVFYSISLYKKVSGPAFGIFATFRAFLKGNTHSRVHLIGSYFLRPQCRKINAFLKYVEKEYVKNN